MSKREVMMKPRVMLLTGVEYKYIPKHFFLICKEQSLEKLFLVKWWHTLFLKWFVNFVWFSFKMFNRPGVAGAFL